jgi:hypothetical protein
MPSTFHAKVTRAARQGTASRLPSRRTVAHRAAPETMMTRDTHPSPPRDSNPREGASGPAGSSGRPTVRNTPSSQAPGDSAGSRSGSALGSGSERTGLGDGQVQDSSQGLAGAQGSGGGADRRPAGAPLRSPPDGGEDPRAEPEGDEAGNPPRYRPDEEAS